MCSDLNVVAERLYAVPVSSFRTLVATVVMTGLPVAGCTQNDCEMATDEIWMSARVTDNGITTRAEFEFRKGGSGPMSSTWACDEAVQFQINGQEAAKVERDKKTEYSLTIDAADEGRAFTFELIREEGTDVRASVELPPPFDMVAPEAGAVVSRSEATELSWTPALEEAEMQIELVEEIGNGLCVTTESEEHDYKSMGGVRVADTGTWTIPGDVLTSESDEECDARYELSRFSEGEYPPELGSGGVVAGQVIRAVVFVSAP